MNASSLILLFWVLGLKYDLESDEVRNLVNSEEVNHDLGDLDFIKIIKFGNLDEYLEDVREIARDDLIETVKEFYKVIKGY